LRQHADNDLPSMWRRHMSTALSPAARETALQRLSEETVDVLVIGGGVTGAGTALDAASRGLTVGLLEQRDWSSGTSSRSSKLIHGGLRYLEMLDFALVREALHERGLLVGRLAPYLVHPVPFLYPLRRRVWERLYVGAGIALYDLLAGILGRVGDRGVPLHRHLGRRDLSSAAPSLDPRVAVGAIRYWDARVDDARLVHVLVRTAVGHGALAASRTRVDGHVEENGRVTGVRSVDLESGRRLVVRARHVVSATGVWTEETQSMFGARGLTVRASKGVHIVVPRTAIEGDDGFILQTDKSVLLIIPWPDHWVIGTTDTPWDLLKDNPAASMADVDYVLDHANAVLRRPLTRADILGVYAGLRPLLQRAASVDTDTSKVSREHTVATVRPGLTVVAGGKYTTFRVMAKDAVDHAMRDRSPGDPTKVPESVTDRLPLAGADGFLVRRNQRERIARSHDWDVRRVERLLDRYGSLIDEVIDLIDARPGLGIPLAGAEAYLRADVVYAVTHEGALHLEDVLVHRTRLSYEQADRGTAVAREVAEVMAPVLGWDEAAIDREVEAYLARVNAEREAEGAPDDRTAEEARLKAQEIRPLNDSATS
jgi:glycerol-3-phosphate dehydrogenase